MLTKTFLLELVAATQLPDPRSPSVSDTRLHSEDITTRPESLKKAIDAHQASFTVLKASLEAAKYEIFDSRIQHSPSYDKAVQSMTRLAQGVLFAHEKRAAKLNVCTRQGSPVCARAAPCSTT